MEKKTPFIPPLVAMIVVMYFCTGLNIFLQNTFISDKSVANSTLAYVLTAALFITCLGFLLKAKWAHTCATVFAGLIILVILVIFGREISTRNFVLSFSFFMVALMIGVIHYIIIDGEYIKSFFAETNEDFQEPQGMVLCFSLFYFFCGVIFFKLLDPIRVDEVLTKWGYPSTWGHLEILFLLYALAAYIVLTGILLLVRYSKALIFARIGAWIFLSGLVLIYGAQIFAVATNLKGVAFGKASIAIIGSLNEFFMHTVTAMIPIYLLKVLQVEPVTDNKENS